MESITAMSALWDRLAGVSSLTFIAKSGRADIGWNGKGQGAVTVERLGARALLFHERGQWTADSGKQLAFTNVYRWTRAEDDSSLGLEHLRFGDQHPVFLFDLKQNGERSWASIEPHVCSEDLYTAELQVDDDELRLNWVVMGPAKNETIQYAYR